MYKENYYDVIVIGSGPAGVTSAIYASDANLNCLIFSGPLPGGLITSTNEVNNLPGLNDMSGQELWNKWEQHLENKNLVTLKYQFVTSCKRINNKIIEITDGNGDIYHTHIVMVCSGSSPKKLSIDNLKSLETSGYIQYCAVCDGYRFSANENNTLCVVGGGNKAIEEVIYLCGLGLHITLIYRGNSLHRPFKSNIIKLQKLVDSNQVDILYNSTITDVIPIDINKCNVIIKSNVTQNSINLKTNAIFVAIGNTPNTQFLSHEDIKMKDGYIVVDNKFETTTSGIYACGDVLGDHVDAQCRHRLRQVTVAQGEATEAMLHAHDKYQETIKVFNQS